MATSASDDVPAQRAALLGRGTVNIRKTNENPPRISSIGTVEAITGQVKHNACKTLDRIKESYPEVSPSWRNFRFRGRGQMGTPFADVRGGAEVIMILP